MIYLYALDYCPEDAQLAVPFSSMPGSSSSKRIVHLLTNYERNLRVGDAFPGLLPSIWPKFTPAPANTVGEQNLRDVFYAEAVWHTGLRLDGEANAGELTLTLPQEHAVSQLFARDLPSGVVYLTVWALDSIGTDPVVVWFGTVLSAEYKNPVCELKGQHVTESLKRQGLTRKHPRTCSYALFSGECGVKQYARVQIATNSGGTAPYWRWREDGFVASVSPDGLTLNVPEAALRDLGFFTNGFVAIEPDYTEGGTEGRAHVTREQVQAGSKALPTDKTYIVGGIRRAVIAHSFGNLTLATPLLEPLPPGARVSLYAGCDKGLNTCKDKFANFNRFGGFPFIPIKNPFESGVKQ